MSVGARRAARKPRRWPYFLVFVIGLAVLAYPVVTRLYYANGAAQVTAGFDKAKAELSPEEVQRRLGLAHA